jgi:chromate reductase
MISESGEINDPTTVEFLAHYLSEFHQFIARVLTVLPRNA